MIWFFFLATIRRQQRKSAVSNRYGLSHSTAATCRRYRRLRRVGDVDARAALWDIAVDVTLSQQRLSLRLDVGALASSVQCCYIGQGLQAGLTLRQTRPTTIIVHRHARLCYRTPAVYDRRGVAAHLLRSISLMKPFHARLIHTYDALHKHSPKTGWLWPAVPLDALPTVCSRQCSTHPLCGRGTLPSPRGVAWRQFRRSPAVADTNCSAADSFRA